MLERLSVREAYEGRGFYVKDNCQSQTILKDFKFIAFWKYFKIRLYC